MGEYKYLKRPRFIKLFAIEHHRLSRQLPPPKLRPNRASQRLLHAHSKGHAADPELDAVLTPPRSHPARQG